MSFDLTMSPLKLSEIPSEDVINKAAVELLDSMSGPEWKPGKSFTKYDVKTFFRSKRPIDGANWHGRVSEHGPDHATFDQFWEILGKDKAENEMKFIPDIKKVAHIKSHASNMEIVSMYYTFSPPISPRVFTVVQVISLNESSPRSGMVVSIPIDLSDEPELLSKEEKGVKGRYVSIEKLTELENGKVEWRMITSNTAAGSIPQYFADRAMPGAISEDIPHFLKWYHGDRLKEATPSTTASAPAPATS